MDHKKAAYALVFIAILLIGAVVRLWVLQYYGFHETDDYVYYSVMLQTLSNGLKIPNPLMLSGFPAHTPFGERSGLIYLTLVPFLLLKFMDKNITLYTVERLLPVISGLLEMIATYVLAYGLTKKRKLALLAMFFLAILPAAVLRTQAGESRGDTYVPTIFAFLLVVMLSYFTGKKTLLKRVGIIIGAALLLLWILETWTAGLYAVGVLAIFALAVAAMLATKSVAKAATITIVVSLLFWGLGWVALPHLMPTYYNYLLGNMRLFGSIQETQPPNLTSLFSWFGFLLVLVPIGIAAFLIKSKKRTNEDYTYLALLATLMVGVLLVSFQIRWIAIPAVPVAIFGAYGLDALVARAAKIKFRFQLSSMAISCFLSLIIIFSVGTVLTQGNPNLVTPQFLNATSWLKNNTPGPSTVMTMWMDGSLVEALANRTVYVDSVNWGQNTGNLSNVNKIYNFSKFLFADSGNFTFLDSTRPDYLLVRENWITAYSGALEYEANVTNVSINETNLYLFLKSNDTVIRSGNVILTRVYGNNDTIIYRVATPS
jgi:asparagine N-glycosylation enzyme membrane subunit Stt3